MSESKDARNAIPVDRWVWGDERIIWGYAPDHAYTLKVLEPKRGRAGCLSLQYHHKKSESWFVLRGTAWALLIVDDQVCTRLMRPNDIQNIAASTVHRLMGVTDDVQVLEPSTPDRHAADKNAPKDVVRLHCVHGREVEKPRSAAEAKLIAQAIAWTEEAIACVEKGTLPPEYNAEFLVGRGSFALR